MRTLNRFVRRSRPAPWHVGHGVSTIEPIPWQRGHGCCSANSPCDVATTPVPVALRAAHRRGPGRGARAVARVAGELELHRHRHLGAAQRVLEGRAHLDLDVVAALPALGLLLAAPG